MTPSRSTGYSAIGGALTIPPLGAIGGTAMKPTIGRIVHYTLRESDAEAVNRRRVKNAGHGESWPAGAKAHVGNAVGTGEIVPMIVTTVWSDVCVNGQAILDGNDSLWVTSALRGEGELGTWCWPAREAP